MQVIHVSDDLLLGSQLVAAARRAGAEFRACLDARQAAGLLSAEPTVVLVDLGSRLPPLEPLMASWRGHEHPPRAILAYGPHVAGELLAAAKGAGCDGVLTRGQLHGQCEAILRQYLAADEDGRGE